MLLIPAATDAIYHNIDWQVFLLSAAISSFIGVCVVLGAKNTDNHRLSFPQAFFLITSGWVVVTIFGAIPFVIKGVSPTDAVFETMSAITTTGSTIFTEIDTLPPGILFWRSILQWIGGIGIIAIAVLILPILRIGGMQLFKIESSGTENESDRFTKSTIYRLSGVYLVLTVLCVLVYYILGMGFFDAVNHAMTTISTGGYSTHNASFGYFENLSLHWAGTIFMICGAIPFFLFVKMTLGNYRAIVSDQQVKGFLLFLLISCTFMTIWLVNEREIGIFHALTLTSFNITSVVTTTGYATDDYTAWGHGAVGMFLVLMFVGGCSGSTAGAIKIYRYQVLWIFVRSHLKKLLSPNRVVIMKYNGRTLTDDVPSSVLAFLAVFIATIAVFTVVLSLLGLDIITAYSASVTAITNVGPGMGHIIGPSGTFQPLSDAAKWVLTVAMLAGRLEVLVLLIFFEKDFWIN
ncbi:Trk system potassium uptake protein [Terasakiella brassicae]|uniref:Trk system potassium uptake protein n=1 Tax=Terasakiella brassicae TaxID=1634917 RepID=A0A917BP66_9PROT|nr:TrkH family potassium uptake protein [Terasakiella brassicae]GGF51489.1 Trk system potassium uptake protein [Terasakiella brassicae]